MTDLLSMSYQQNWFQKSAYLDKQLLSTYCVPGTVLSAGETTVNEVSQKSLSFRGLHSLEKNKIEKERSIVCVSQLGWRCGTV